MCGFEQGRTGASRVTQVKCQNPSIHKIQQLTREKSGAIAQPVKMSETSAGPGSLVALEINQE